MNTASFRKRTTGVRKIHDFVKHPHCIRTASNKHTITVHPHQQRLKEYRIRATRDDNQVPNPNVVALERVLKDVLVKNAPIEERYKWSEICESWVLRPTNAPEAIVHFLGGAFIGVAPQLAYRQFLESLADRNVLVIATPFSTHFDHHRSADESQYKFERALDQLTNSDPQLSNVPIYGVGHSLGALLHVLISSKYAIHRDGNVLISFNNKPATEVVPMLSQIAPTVRFLRPILTQAATSPFRPTAELIRDAFRDLSPSLIRQVTPIADQFLPIYFDVAQGNQEFTPSPSETRTRLRNYYSVSRNLLVKFRDDEIDETEELVSLIQSCGSVAELDLTIRSLAGDHGRPMQPTVVDLPPEVTRAANAAFKTGGGLIDQLSKLAENAGQSEGVETLSRLSKGVSSIADAFSSDSSGVFKNSVASLANEITTWMGITTTRNIAKLKQNFNSKM
eukprot:g8739.t1